MPKISCSECSTEEGAGVFFIVLLALQLKKTLDSFHFVFPFHFAKLNTNSSRILSMMPVR